MGSYWSLSVGGLQIMEGKNSLDAGITALFSEPDRRLSKRGDGRGDHARNAYVVSAADMRTRLALCGISEKLVQRVFAAGIRQRIEEQVEWLEEYADDDNKKVFQNGIDQLRNLSFDRWLGAVRAIIRKKAEPIHDHTKPPPTGLTKFERFILSENLSDGLHLGFPVTNEAIILYAFCEAVPNTEVILDYDDLVRGGYLSGRSKHTDLARHLLAMNHLQCAPIIILTEGSTDARLLRSAMELLHPRLAHMFSFFDFAGSNSAGGTGALVALVKAFAAARVQARIVALVDNDTAGHAAMASLPKLPANIVVSPLPDFDFLNSYPTLGPKPLRMNVNGQAASLELYMGRDVLKQGRSFTPVRWSGFDGKLKKYQGELVDKRGVQNRAAEKLRAAATSGSLDVGDWAGLRIVCSHIIKLAARLRFGKHSAAEFLLDY